MDAYGAGLLDTKTYPMADSNEHEPNTLFIELPGQDSLKLTGSLFPPTRLLPNRNQERFPVRSIGTEKWRGTGRTVPRLGALHYPIPTVTDPGVSHV